jgi:hypothetical protein
MKSTSKLYPWIMVLITAASLPILFAIFPSLLHYANNVKILNIGSLERMAVANLFLAILIFVIFVLIKPKAVTHSAIAAFIFLIFFNLYGILYNALLKLDLIQIEHYNLLPLYFLLAIYMSFAAFKLKDDTSKNVWKLFLISFTILSIYNIARILPTEIKKYNRNDPVVNAKSIELQTDEKYPDIYYFVFDEFSGLEAMRQYWHDTNVDRFKEFLSSKGFYIAEESHGSTIDTLHQMAIRLNYKDYPLGAAYVDTYYQDIADNRVMKFLKRKGYTTIVFDETRVSFAYPAKPPIESDINYEYDSSVDSETGGFLFDEYGMLVADKTMLLAFSKLYKINNPEHLKHKNMLYFTADKVGDFKDISPKFVYVHLMIPHMPFMFDANGGYVDPKFHQNWDYYLGNYLFTINLIKQMVSNILSNSDPDNPPIIILQSDHGARNKPTPSPESKILKEFPEEYKTLILNSLYLPDCENAPLSQDMDPINTFPIIFNCVFDAQIPLK